MENLKKWFEDRGYNTVEVGVDQLKEELGIKVKAYEMEGLYVFNYSQIDSPKTHPVVMECRGLILTNDFEVVCRPFDRFFNFGEALEITDKFNFTTSTVVSKEDGSLVKVYFWDGEWRVATRGTAFAESENYTGEVFQDLILEAFGVDSLQEFSDRCCYALDTDYTYIFEYVSPKNRVVTRYEDSCMYLLGIRKNSDGSEVTDPRGLEWIAQDLQDVCFFNVKRPETYSFKDQKQMLEFAKGLSDLSEGVVAHDPVSGIRVKVKAEFYVKVHHLRGECLPTPKKIIGLVVTNETEEYLTYFPEDRDLFSPYQIAWSTFQAHIGFIWGTVKDIEDQKDFALRVKDRPESWVYFQARKECSDPVEVLLNADISKREKALERYFG